MASDAATPGGNRTNGDPGAPLAPKDAGLGRELGGDLPCVVCGYNLRGLSIRSMCPECGANVRATILSLVDPHASELQPIPFPRLTAAGVVLWAFGAVAVTMMSWLPQAADLMQQIGIRAGRPSAALGVFFGICTSGVGSISLIRPHGRIPRGHTLMAALATVLYAPLAWVLWRYHTECDRVGGQHYFSRWSSTVTRWRPTAEMSIDLAAAGALIAGIIMLQRPNARLLVARSMVLRTGRVDRQTMYAMAVAACVMAVGALLGVSYSDKGMLATIGDAARVVGVVMIAMSGVLLSIGALGSLLDAARIAGAILIPKVTVRQVIREGRPAPRSRFMKMIDPTPPHAPHARPAPPPPSSGPGGGA